MKIPLALGLALTLLTGCYKKDEAKATAPVPPISTLAAPTAATPAPVPPNAVADGVQRPAPGQANDHSSPSFVDGGKSDPKK